MSELFGYEIDFLPVGNGDSSGDAIAIKYGYPSNFRIMIVDGGTKESGESLVEHVRNIYKSNHVDFVVNTHPDMDHASGLSVVLEELEVGSLWIHRPWLYSADLCQFFDDGRITPNSLSERLKDKLSAAHRLEELATEKNIPIYEPYQGQSIGNFTVLSPSFDFYYSILPYFNKTPEPKVAVEISSAFFENKYLKKIMAYAEERWDYETLREGGTTSYDNESSVILYGNLNGNGILLTGDAGVSALNQAADYAEYIGVDLTKSTFIQIPHHGSRNNVSPSILDRIVGPKVGRNHPATKTAYVSAGENSTTHPRRVVVNAFIRRGCKVISTAGIGKTHFRNIPNRSGWSDVTPLPFFNEVEKYD